MLLEPWTLAKRLRQPAPSLASWWSALCLGSVTRGTAPAPGLVTARKTSPKKTRHSVAGHCQLPNTSVTAVNPTTLTGQAAPTAAGAVTLVGLGNYLQERHKVRLR